MESVLLGVAGHRRSPATMLRPDGDGRGAAAPYASSKEHHSRTPRSTAGATASWFDGCIGLDIMTSVEGISQASTAAGTRSSRTGGVGQRSPDAVVRNYTLGAASHSSKLGPASVAPGLGSAAPSE